ncbi:MAG TPA: glycosyltransferase family 1 protein, partial [Planctomycetota bacterium]|nr:glycosyltransferase family 1 protein [Planctomycetota bacterium]
VSEAVKRDVLATLSPDPSKLRVVYEAAGDSFYPRTAGEVQLVRLKYDLHAPYFMFIGSVNKRKNVPTQIEAFCRARAQAKSEAVLAIAGRIGYGGEEIQDLIRRSGAGAVKLLGYVPDEDVPSLYTGAQGLLLATLYEGFGIPAVEAFSCGCPVVGANVGSLPEIIGEAGLLADPKNVDSIAVQIIQLMNDEPLRKTLAARGRERAKQFSWEKAADECLAIYRELSVR